MDNYWGCPKCHRKFDKITKEFPYCYILQCVCEIPYTSVEAEKQIWNIPEEKRIN